MKEGYFPVCNIQHIGLGLVLVTRFLLLQQCSKCWNLQGKLSCFVSTFT